MMTQLSLFGEAHSCESCAFYSPLRAPRERSDGAVIYGYCFKGATQNHSPNGGKGYAVFLPDGVCSKYKEKE